MYDYSDSGLAKYYETEAHMADVSAEYYANEAHDPFMARIISAEADYYRDMAASHRRRNDR
jgi:hypothetical protein